MNVPPTVEPDPLRKAWDEKNAIQFQNCLTEHLSPGSLNEIVKKIVLETTDHDYNSASFTFANIIFENHLHRKAFQGQPSLVFQLLENGNSKILELLLKYKPNLRAIDGSGNSPLHYLCNKHWHQLESHKKCMDLLLNHNEIDVNDLNNEKDTPLDVAVLRHNWSAVEMLLNCNKKLQRRPNSPQTVITDIPAHLSEKLSKVDETTGTTIPELYLLLKKGQKGSLFTEEFPLAMKNTAFIVELTGKLNIFLQEACKHDLIDEVIMLMNYGADPSVEDVWNDSRTAISVAVENGRIQILPLLLERASAINFKLDNSRNNSLNVNKEDANHNTALYYAVRYGNDKAILEILKMGGYLGAENDRGENPLAKIPARVMNKFLNSQLKQVKNGGETSENHTTVDMNQKTTQYGYNREKFIFDCRFLKRPSKTNKGNSNTHDLKLLKQMTDIKELRPLITHPVLRSFILLKWKILKVLFFINVVFYAILNCLITFNVLYMSITGQDAVLATIVIQGLFILLFLLQEILQILIRGMEYIKQFENYFELMTIGLGATLCVMGSSSHLEVIRHLGACVVLVSWLGFLLFIGKHPIFSVPVEMFRLVLWSFVKFFSVYLIMIIAFAISFFVLFNDSSDPCDHAKLNETCVDDFSNIGTSVFKTLVMISGDFDLSNMPFLKYPITSHIIFVLFLFLIAIVLLNLLNGLAVYDTKMIKEDAILHSYVSRVRYLASLEELLFSVSDWSFFEKVTKHFVQFKFEIVNSEKILYKMDPDILKVAREIAIKNSKDSSKVEEKSLVDVDTRLDVNETILNLIENLNKKVDQMDEKLKALNDALAPSTLITAL